MDDLAQFFKALSDETRLRIITLLIWEEKLCVCDMEKVLELSQSKVSRHLRYLVNSGILKDERESIWVYYSINKKLSYNKMRFLNNYGHVINGDESYLQLKDKLGLWLKSKKRSNKCK